MDIFEGGRLVEVLVECGKLLKRERIFCIFLFLAKSIANKFLGLCFFLCMGGIGATTNKDIIRIIASLAGK